MVKENLLLKKKMNEYSFKNKKYKHEIEIEKEVKEKNNLKKIIRN